MKLLLRLLLLCSACLTSWAQDVHLTQYYTSNLSLNPAFTGHFDGDVKMVANYRSQWSQVGSPIKTSMFSIEKKFQRLRDDIGVGLLFIDDQTGLLQLRSNKVMLAGSYEKNINNNLIRFGLQAGLVYKSLSLAEQSFPSQWNYATGNYETATPNGENSFQNSVMYPGINAGLGWERIFGKKRVVVGYGLFNINRPKEKFITANQSLPFRHVVSARATFYTSEQLSITPQILYMYTAQATDFMAGANLKRKFNDEFSGLIGLGYRGSTTNSDAAFGIAGFTYKRIEFGFNMDFNISTLSQDARRKSVWEFSISYTTPSRIPSKVTIPCDRF